uniref:Uncharacterized protein n=1 Tax=Oryza sativa subsp. japonica TaxID=39947 RepID=Q9FW95_ORYSJ|nr:hypothetical protein [Oryza sativa Japonica Group]
MEHPSAAAVDDDGDDRPAPIATSTTCGGLTRWSGHAVEEDLAQQGVGDLVAASASYLIPL